LRASPLTLNRRSQGTRSSSAASRSCPGVLHRHTLMSSAGGVWAQPVLGRAADAWGYGPSYALSAGIAALGLPFLALARRRTVRGEGLGMSAALAPQPA
jgi:hypothetical protein